MHCVQQDCFKWIVISILLSGSIAGLVTLIVKLVPRHKHSAPPPDGYTKALHKALMFFNAQRSGPLPKHNNVSWRGNSCMRDGLSDPGANHANLVGGFYDAGDAIKFNFPGAFTMTMLNWSVIEYTTKYEAPGELNHVKGIIKWGEDYFLRMKPRLD